MSPSPLETRMAPARARWTLERALGGAVHGLLAGSLLGLAFAAARLFGAPLGTPFGTVAAMPAVLGLALAGALFGGLLGVLRVPSWSSTAQAIDQHFALKDRIATAVALADLKLTDQEAGAADPRNEADRRLAESLRALQAQDALLHLSRIESARAIPVRTPRRLPWALGSTVLALVLAGWPARSSQAVAGVPTPDPRVQALAEELRSQIEDLEERLEGLRGGEADESRESKELTQELREIAEQLEDPDAGLREALASLSKMQELLAEQQAKLNTELVDAQLAALGESMQGSADLRKLSQALEAGDFPSAQEALDEIEEKGLSDSASQSSAEQRADQETTERMKNVAGEMKKNNLPEWSQATEAVSEALSSRSKGKGESAAERMGDLLEQHARNSAMNQAMAGMGKKLGEAKGGMTSQGENASAQKGEGDMPGDSAASDQNSLSRALGKKTSDQESTNWGMATAGETEGPSTQLDAERQRQEITGTLGEGPSEKSTLEGEAHTERSRRDYREVHQEYQKISETVLENEAIPLGYRENIRRYFRAIRPTTEEARAVDRSDAGGGGR